MNAQAKVLDDPPLGNEPVLPISYAAARWEELLQRFPARAVPSTWPASRESLEEVMDRISRPPLRTEKYMTQRARDLGASAILRWLSSFPGSSWQERWHSSQVKYLGRGWVECRRSWN